jgi:hypothetical protein
VASSPAATTSASPFLIRFHQPVFLLLYQSMTGLLEVSWRGRGAHGLALLSCNVELYQGIDIYQGADYSSG